MTNQKLNLDKLEERICVAKACGCAAVVPVEQLGQLLAELREARAQLSASGLLSREALDEELQQIDDAIVAAGGKRDQGAVSFIESLVAQLREAAEKCRDAASGTARLKAYRHLQNCFGWETVLLLLAELDAAEAEARGAPSPTEFAILRAAREYAAMPNDFTKNRLLYHAHALRAGYPQGEGPDTGRDPDSDLTLANAITLEES